jgi:hypothetical protein
LVVADAQLAAVFHRELAEDPRFWVRTERSVSLRVFDLVEFGAPSNLGRVGGVKFSDTARTMPAHAAWFSAKWLKKKGYCEVGSIPLPASSDLPVSCRAPQPVSIVR